MTEPQPLLEPAVTSQGAPYRAAPEEPVTALAPSVPRVVTVWAPALGIFGVLLWAFVVMGQLVTSYAPGRQAMLIGEGTGALGVLAATTAAWVVACRRSLRASPARGVADRISRGLVLGLVPLLGWCATLMFASLAGKAGDGLITVLLLAIAGAAVFYGQRLSADSNAPATTECVRVVARVLWVGAALLTFAAIVALAAS